MGVVPSPLGSPVPSSAALLCRPQHRVRGGRSPGWAGALDKPGKVVGVGHRARGAQLCPTGKGSDHTPGFVWAPEIPSRNLRVCIHTKLGM